MRSSLILIFSLSAFSSMAVLSKPEITTLSNLAKRFCARAVNSSTVNLNDLPNCSQIMTKRECLMFNYMNAFREFCSLPTFTASRACTHSAKEQSSYMAKTGKFHHLSTAKLWSRLEKHGAKPRRISENIAMQSTNYTPLRAMKRLVLSQGHRRNLMNKKSEFAGVGLSIGRLKSMKIRYWTQCFYGE